MFQYVGLIYDFVSSQYNIDDKLISLKLRHTVRVYKLMVKLIERLSLNNSDAIVLYLAFQDQLVFKESRDILYEKGYLDEFINSI